MRQARGRSSQTVRVAWGLLFTPKVSTRDVASVAYLRRAESTPLLLAAPKSRAKSASQASGPATHRSVELRTANLTIEEGPERNRATCLQQSSDSRAKASFLGIT